MARRVVTLEEKIEKAQINVAETKVKYDKAVCPLPAKIDRKKVKKTE